MIPGPRRSAGEGIGYLLQYSWAFLVAQLVRNPPAMQTTWIPSLGWEDPMEKGKATHTSIMAGRRHKESDMTEQLSLLLFPRNKGIYYFHSINKNRVQSGVTY